MAQKIEETNNWPEMFVGLYERLTGNNALWMLNLMVYPFIFTLTRERLFSYSKTGRMHSFFSGK